MSCAIENCNAGVAYHIVQTSQRRVSQKCGYCEGHFHRYLMRYLATRRVGPGVPLRADGGVALDVELIVWSDKPQPFCRVYLREVGGTRDFEWVFGWVETRAVYLAIEEIDRLRPLTHEAIILTIAALGGTLQDVIVDQFDEAIPCHHAKLRIIQGQRMALVDVRPSDALTLSIYGKVPFYIREDLLERGKQKV